MINIQRWREVLKRAAISACMLLCVACGRPDSDSAAVNPTPLVADATTAAYPAPPAYPLPRTSTPLL